MSSKKKTTSNQSQSSAFNSQYQYDPQAMAGYHQAVTAMQGMAANPFNNPFYNLSLSQNMGGANRMNATATQALGTSLRQRGIDENSPMAAAMSAYQNRVNSGNNANAFLQAANTAQANYWNSISGLTHPLQTGSSGTSTGQMQGTSTEGTSGLGSWLPQVVGAGVGVATGLGGAGLLGSGIQQGMNSGTGFGGFLGAMGGYQPTPQFGSIPLRTPSVAPALNYPFSSMQGMPNLVPFNPAMPVLQSTWSANGGQF